MIGSYFYAAHPPAALPNERIVEVINLDMVGSHARTSSSRRWVRSRATPRASCSTASRQVPEDSASRGRHRARLGLRAVLQARHPLRVLLDARQALLSRDVRPARRARLRAHGRHRAARGCARGGDGRQRNRFARVAREARLRRHATALTIRHSCNMMSCMISTELNTTSSSLAEVRPALGALLARIGRAQAGLLCDSRAHDGTPPPRTSTTSSRATARLRTSSATAVATNLAKLSEVLTCAMLASTVDCGCIRGAFRGRALQRLESATRAASSSRPG